MEYILINDDYIIISDTHYSRIYHELNDQLNIPHYRCKDGEIVMGMEVVGSRDVLDIEYNNQKIYKYINKRLTKSSIDSFNAVLKEREMLEKEHKEKVRRNELKYELRNILKDPTTELREHILKYMRG